MVDCCVCEYCAAEWTWMFIPLTMMSDVMNRSMLPLVPNVDCQLGSAP